MLKTSNVLIGIALKYSREYVTPEDVSEALTLHDVWVVRMDLLEVIAGVMVRRKPPK